MTKPRKSKPQQASEKRSRSGVAIQAYIDPDVRTAMDAFIDSYNSEHDHKASVTSTIEAALKKYLADQGYWPLDQRPRNA